MKRTGRRRLIASALSIAVGTLTGGGAARADVKLAPLFTDHMVLQRGVKLPIWGEASAGEKVSVEFPGGPRADAVADPRGHWQAVLEPRPADGTGNDLRVVGQNSIILHDVLVGDVWLCAGQSNMVVGLGRLTGADLPKGRKQHYTSPQVEAEAGRQFSQATHATTPGLRIYRVRQSKTDPAVQGWMPANPQTLDVTRPEESFSAVAYFFGKNLQSELNVPVGVIQCAVGNTRIETWTPPEAYAHLPVLGAGTEGRLKLDDEHPGGHFRAMVQPLAPFAIRGVAWYQGESNVIAGDGLIYAPKLEALIESWRALWQRPDLPFLIVQLPCYDYSRRYKKNGVTPRTLAWLREAQMKALALPHTAVAGTLDVGDPVELHPADKWDVGRRLALLALTECYGRTDVVSSGPRYQSVTQRGGTMVVTFSGVGKGLLSRDGKPLSDFTVAGNDHTFVPATARIEGNTVVVSSPAVSDPVAVRFAWSESAMPNLFNGDGLPAMPFRTDNWPEN